MTLFLAGMVTGIVLWVGAIVWWEWYEGGHGR